MKLKNKKTGEIIDSKELLTDEYLIALFSKDFNYFNSKINKIQEDWEDYEEPKEYHYITNFSSHPFSKCDIGKFPLDDEYRKEIGNYFETKEEAEKAVEKLKAWKRLKDKGFKVDLWDYDGCNYQERITTGRILFRVKDNDENDKDLDLLFGGEE